MIVFPAGELKRLADLVEAAYPFEACGLLVGSTQADGRRAVSRLEPSENLAAEPARRFEVDMRLRLRLQRRLRGTGEEIVGLYHSHPDGTAAPSAIDLAEAWEPELVWIVAAVAGGQMTDVAAHLLAEDGKRFEEIALESAAEQHS